MQVDRCIGNHIRRTFTRQETAQHRCSLRCSATVSKEPGCTLWARSWHMIARWVEKASSNLHRSKGRASRAEEAQLKTAGFAYMPVERCRGCSSCTTSVAFLGPSGARHQPAIFLSGGRLRVVSHTDHHVIATHCESATCTRSSRIKRYILVIIVS